MREIVPTLYGVLSTAEREDQMQQAINMHLPFLKKATAFGKDKISIVCYGPSLLDTWRTAREMWRSGQKIITVSGAHDFLFKHEVIPDYHVEIDPRPHKPRMLRLPGVGTKYLMASVCHPDFWTVLEHCSVQLWHLIDGPDTVDWVRQHHPAGLDSMIGGGSTVGQRAMNVAAALGYRRFDIFGMDCSFSGQRHAGAHTGQPQPEVRAEVSGRFFRTTPQLFQSAKEMQDFLLTMDAEVHFHGDGMVQEMAAMIQRRKR